nr:hypothetical protein [Sphingobium sp. B11D3B]
MLAVLSRMIFVEDGQHGDGHVGCWIVAEVLCYRDNANLPATQALPVLHEIERVAEQARERMDEDDVDRAFIGFGERDHLPESTSLIIGGASSFGKYPNARGAVFFYPALGAGNLIRKRKIVSLLTYRRYPRVNENALALEVQLHTSTFWSRYSSMIEESGNFSAKKPVQQGDLLV